MSLNSKSDRLAWRALNLKEAFITLQCELSEAQNDDDDVKRFITDILTSLTYPL